MATIVGPALEFGLLLSALLFGFVLLVLRLNPEILLDDYPPAIKAKWGLMSPRTRRQRIVVAAIIFLIIAAVVVGSVRSLRGIVGGDVTFAAAFLHLAIMFGTFNLLDWLVLDCALVYWQPRFVVLPGTEGMVEYRSYWFGFRGFLIGIPIVLVGSLVVAAIVAAVV